jgi:L-asparaginase
LKLLIISTGGTINKAYDEISGELCVQSSDAVAKSLCMHAKENMDVQIQSIIHKDSLEMTDEDRDELACEIARADEDNIIVLHGTDTMDKSAKVVAKSVKDKKIVFVGAMKPYAYEKDEAIFNFACAVGFLRANPANGVYISMHSLVLEHDEIYKDKTVGEFKALK